MTKDRIEIRVTSIPWKAVSTFKEFILPSIGIVKEGDALYICMCVNNELLGGYEGYLLYNLTCTLFAFWPKENDNIHEYFVLAERGDRWEQDFKLLQMNKGDFVLEIGPRG